jgi:hypothetical protein
MNNRFMNREYVSSSLPDFVFFCELYFSALTSFCLSDDFAPNDFVFRSRLRLLPRRAVFIPWFTSIVTV